jgi:hypothetical protein
VQHTGRLIRGPGIFEIVPRGEHSTFVWTERLYLPYGYLGMVAGTSSGRSRCSASAGRSSASPPSPPGAGSRSGVPRGARRR